MASTTRLGIHQPIGTLKATATAGGTTTTFLCSNANAATLVADNTTVYRLYSTATALALIQDLNLTVLSKQVDTPGAGTTTVTFGQALASATLTNQVLYIPEIIDYVSAINNQFDTLDAVYDAVSTTESGLAGVSPYQGMLAWTTDTNFLYQYNGSAWVFVSGWNRPRGYITETTRSSAGGTVAQGDPENDTGYEVAFTADASRMYKVMCHINWNKIAGTIPNSPYVKVRFRQSLTAASPTITSTLVGEFVQDVTENAEGNTVRGEYIFPWAPAQTGPVVLGLFFLVNSPAATSVAIDSAYSAFTIFDMGPVDVN